MHTKLVFIHLGDERAVPCMVRDVSRRTVYAKHAVMFAIFCSHNRVVAIVGKDTAGGGSVLIVPGHALRLRLKTAGVSI